MEKNLFQKINYKLSLEFDDDSDNKLWLQSGLTLRTFVGIAGMALPFLVWFFLYMATGRGEPLDSISHYYYTRVDSIFIIVMGLLAIFLILYKGPKAYDFYLSTIAGFAALVLIFWPTSSIVNVINDPNTSYSNTVIQDLCSRELIHYISSGIFLFILAMMSICIFTKSDKKWEDMGKMKRRRNRVYIFCGIIMLLCILIIWLGSTGKIFTNFYDDYHLTFWMETIAVEFFGFSWLVKGGVILKDITLKNQLN